MNYHYKKLFWNFHGNSAAIFVAEFQNRKSRSQNNMKKQIRTGQIPITKYILRSSKPNVPKSTSNVKMKTKPAPKLPKRSPLSEINTVPQTRRVQSRKTIQKLSVNKQEPKQHVTKLKSKHPDDDPYDFDSFIDEYEKENPPPKLKKIKKPAKKCVTRSRRSLGSAKENSVTNKSKKSRTRPKSRIPLGVKKLVAVNQVREKLPNQDDFSCGNADSEKKYTEYKIQELVVLRERIGVSSKKVASPAVTKATESERFTSTPQATESAPPSPCRNLQLDFSIDDVSFADLKLSPIRLSAASQEDLNFSGFVAENNFRTYCRSNIDRKRPHPNVDLEPPCVEIKQKKRKKNNDPKAAKKFDKWATEANKTFLDAEHFELVIE